MTQVGYQEETGDGNGAYIFRLVAPATGTHSIAVTLGGAPTSAGAFSASLFGVDQTTTIDVSGGVNVFGNSGTISLTTTANNDWIVDSYSGFNTWSSWGASQTDIGHTATNGSQGASYEGPVSTGSNTTTVNFSGFNQAAYVSASILAASGGGSTPTCKRKRLGVGC